MHNKLSSPAWVLRSGLDATWQKIYAKPLRQCEKDYKKWSVASTQLETVNPSYFELVQLLLFLKHELSEHFKVVERLRTRQTEFNYNYLHAASAVERAEHMAAVAKFLGYPSRIIRKTVSNKLQWFDDAAISERFEKQISEQEKYIVFLLERLCDGTRLMLDHVEDDDELAHYWGIVALPTGLIPSLSYQPQASIRIAACKGLRRILQQLPATIKRPLPTDITQYVYRVCLDSDVHIWMRAEMMALIAVTRPTQYLEIFHRVLSTEPKADVFLKGRMVETLLRFLPAKLSLAAALKGVHHESSDYVRQRFAECSKYLPADVVLRLGPRLMPLESSAQVKAQFLLVLLHYDWTPTQLNRLVADLVTLLKNHSDVFLIRTAFHVLPQFFCQFGSDAGCAQDSFEAVDEQLTWFNNHHQDTRVRRWAAECREAIFFYTSSAQISGQDQQRLQLLPLEETMTLRLPDNKTDESWLRQLSFIGSKRFGFNVRLRGSKAKVWSGFRFHTRLWRIIHEWRTPATDKRQNHNHVKGRVFYGLHQFNSRIVAEQSITKVPGEPVYISQEAGERAYLPLVDQLISCLDQGWPTQPLQIFSSEGITEVLPPSSFLARLKARWHVQWQFAKLSRLRNWQEGDSFDATAYLKKVSQLGFKVKVRGYADSKGKPYPVDPRVQRFFPTLALPITLPSLSDAYNYFYSVYQNTISQLLAFTTVFLGGFLANHIRQLVDLRRHRKKIPLVIGGWGTRGKSGTERLKAAVLNELGLSVLSKTTGCEAMFLYGNANRPMKEMFLFRPYDKATIWEQVFLTKFGGRLGVDVFLWECMGLTPRYIEILQSQWMRDDISTITNCYPDHEDIQGPAGIEIPIVMQKFISKNGDVFTSEESMLPVLQDAAYRKNASLTAVTWLQSGLITDDVLERFPYAEHPNNIALVSAMSERLGVRHDVAVKAMADRVIADLGVLKIYPKAAVQGRLLEFVNGMSANERLGALGNWERTGFDAHHLSDDPEIWTSIVVNNRADRVARSQVFAGMLVSDIHADRYYFIGDNLDGLQTYIQEAWDRFVEQFTDSQHGDELEKKLTTLCQRFRIATEQQPIKNRIAAALTKLKVPQQLVSDGVDKLVECQSEEQVRDCFNGLKQALDADTVRVSLVDSIADMAVQMQLEYVHWQSLKQAGSLNSSGSVAEVLDWIYSCFKQRWVVIENYYSTGNQTIQTLVDHSPPGLTTRVIGVQNIKGTGLDFVYRWQAWDKVYSQAVVLRESRSVTDVQAAARALATWQEYGVLDAEFMAETIAIARDRQVCQQESIQADLTIIEQQLNRQLKKADKAVNEGTIDSGWRYKTLSVLEDFLDSGDAIKRRKRAQAIYRAILDNVISMERATVELAELNKAQKGGWLIRLIKRRLADKDAS